MSRLALDSSETVRLVAAARAGDPGARDALLARHRRYMSRFVSLRIDPRLRQRLDPSDVVQEAQAEAARRFSDYLDQPVIPFRLWLRRIAYDRLLMLRRRHVKTLRRELDREVDLADVSSRALVARLMDLGPSPSQDLLRKEFARRVRDAVGQLVPADAEIILLRNYEGLTNEEAAHLLGIRADSASRRYGRALLRLRKLLLDLGLSGLPP